MRRYLRIAATLLMLAAMLVPAGAQGYHTITLTNGTANLFISDSDIVLSSEGISRAWNRDRLDERDFLITKSFGITNDRWPDFALQLGGVVVPSTSLNLIDVRGEVIDGGVRLTWEAELPGTLRVTRFVEAYDGVGALETRTLLEPMVSLTLGGYTLDEISASGIPASADAHAFRAGADWRYDGWDPVSIGDHHPGQWRQTTTAEQLTTIGEWLDVNFRHVNGNPYATISMVMERRNMASSMVAWSGSVAGVGVDFSRDVAYSGPIEEEVHVENPAPRAPQVNALGLLRTPQPGARGRLLLPGRPLELERVVTTIGASPDVTAWRYHEYLTRQRLTPYPKAVTFNTNGVDTNALSTGLKDDVDFARFLTLAAAARELGVETFVFDDGWQARSGDWCPDSATCPEPRWDGEDQRFEPRFPDDEFRAVREVLAGDPADPSDDMALGLWMAPMNFHPSAAAFQESPQWACAPLGDVTAAPSLLLDNGSWDAGIGIWNPSALGTHPDTGEPMRFIRYQEDRIRRAVEVYGARYFKFDFMTWVDCAGAEPVDMYDYHDGFVAMVDRLQRSYPHVTFSIDDTNDHRMFPFESAARGPMWFQNGKPSMKQLLHNLWNLAPYVPGFAIGQHTASNNAERAEKGVDVAMAVSLGSHMTFWNAIDVDMTPTERAQIKKWTDFYKEHRDTIATFTFPLLADPLDGGWTGLQPWDLEQQSGWVLAYRQGSEQAIQQIPLRGITWNETYTLTAHDPADGSVTPLGTMTSAQLVAGLPVTIGSPHGYALIRVERV